ncbi:MAG: hypothetical protein KA105_02735 [Caulobacter sp.]|nr:hypothetical protein [Caulobacter sp.]
MKGVDRRSPQAQAWRALYKTKRWRDVRALQLATSPLCERCAQHGRVTRATVCDHVDPKTKADPATFYSGPFQSLCDAPPWRCHSRAKQHEEAVGYQPGCDMAGRPKAADHPWNRTKPAASRAV